MVHVNLVVTGYYWVGGSSEASECSMECMEKLLGEPVCFL